MVEFTLEELDAIALQNGGFIPARDDEIFNAGLLAHRVLPGLQLLHNERQGLDIIRLRTAGTRGDQGLGFRD